MGSILRKLCIWICIPIYDLIPSIYNIFYALASARLFGDDSSIIQQLSQNLYVLISVIMLFGFSITILSAIVNPDLLSDNKKGLSAMFKRSVIGLALIVLVPFCFDKMYEIQKSVMSSSLIEKVIVGIDMSCDENDTDCEPGQGGGQVIAGMLINSVLYPAEETVIIDADVENNYKLMVQTDIRNIASVASDINSHRKDNYPRTNPEDGDYGFHFDGFIAIIAGLCLDYVLILFALDVAVRMFKLVFLELTAPISIVGYIAAGNKILTSWLKQVGTTFVSVFIRIAAMAFYLFLMHNLDTFFEEYSGKSWGLILKVFMIVGMLIFAKQIPSLIGKIFGIEIKTQGGIGGRLGQMAMVGKQAEKAWNGIKRVAEGVAGVTALGLGAASHPIATGLIGFGHHAWKKGIGNMRPIEETRFGRRISAWGGTAGAYLRANNGFAAVKDANKAWSESEFGKARAKEKSIEKDNKRFGKLLTALGLNKEDEMPADPSASYGLFSTALGKNKVLGKKQKEATDSKFKADFNKKRVEDAKAKYDAIVDRLNHDIDTEQNVQKQENLKRLLANVSKSFSTQGNIASFINEYRNNVVDSSGMERDAEKIKQILNLSQDIRNEAASNSGGFVSAVKTLNKKYTATANTAKSNYDKVKETASPYQKEELEFFEQKGETIISEAVDAITKGSFNQQMPISTPTPTASGYDSRLSQDQLDELIAQGIRPTDPEYASALGNFGIYGTDSNIASAAASAATAAATNAATAAAASAATSAAGNSFTNSPGQSQTVQVEGMKDMFKNLESTITSANSDTNRILEDQLREQKNMNVNLGTQNSNINKVAEKVEELNTSFNDSSDFLKKKVNEQNENLEKINKKLDE